MIEQVRPASLRDWIASQGGTALVLDVREPAELQVARVATEGFNVKTIPMMDVPARLAELDPKQPVAVLCHHGARSQRVAMFLTGNGFASVANIAGGIDAWSQELDAAVARY